MGLGDGTYGHRACGSEVWRCMGMQESVCGAGSDASVMWGFLGLR